jgi:hypothetical protein
MLRLQIDTQCPSLLKEQMHKIRISPKTTMITGKIRNKRELKRLQLQAEKMLFLSFVNK